ncbi:peptidase inhibitor family I36 protein [Actinomadura fulvescens]|uniref:Peptidase inhibitor family I36 n=1 Tax=Actinomadura fulvescens TaxID=46160 RepID=A0ABP6CF54_9ACTN
MRTLGVLVGTAAALVAGTAVPGAASTEPPKEGPSIVYRQADGSRIACPAGYMCLYTGPNFTGVMVRWPAGSADGDFTKIQCPPQYCTNGDFNDDASSWHNNNTGHKYCISEHVGGGGWDNSTPNNTSGNLTGRYNNTASALSYLGCP